MRFCFAALGFKVLKFGAKVISLELRRCLGLYMGSQPAV